MSARTCYGVASLPTCMTMGEIFYLKDLADDCVADKVYEFMFVAPAIPITGTVGSPTNPLAIK